MPRDLSRQTRSRAWPFLSAAFPRGPGPTPVHGLEPRAVAAAQLSQARGERGRPCCPLRPQARRCSPRGAAPAELTRAGRRGTRRGSPLLNGQWACDMAERGPDRAPGADSPSAPPAGRTQPPPEGLVDPWPPPQGPPTERRLVAEAGALGVHSLALGYLCLCFCSRSC